MPRREANEFFNRGHSQEYCRLRFGINERSAPHTTASFACMGLYDLFGPQAIVAGPFGVVDDSQSFSLRSKDVYVGRTLYIRRTSPGAICNETSTNRSFKLWK